MAVSCPRYAGTSGRTHGERKLITPAASATRIVRSVPDIGGQASRTSWNMRRSLAALVASSSRRSPNSTTGMVVKNARSRAGSVSISRSVNRGVGRPAADRSASMAARRDRVSPHRRPPARPYRTGSGRGASCMSGGLYGEVPRGPPEWGMARTQPPQYDRELAAGHLGGCGGGGSSQSWAAVSSGTGVLTGPGPMRRFFVLLVGLLLLAAVATPVDAAAVSVVRHGPRTENRIALTIDDGWNTPNCRAMLQVLERERVPATWFPIAMYVKSRASFWKEVARLGYPIANHTYDHKTLSKLSYQAQLDDIVRARDTMAAAGIPMVPILRPPAGAWNNDTLIAAEAAGYTKLLIWDTTVADSSRRGSDASHLRQATHGRPGSIVLMHCGPDMTVRLLPQIIASYRSRGYQFVTVPQLLGMPGPLPRFLPSP